METYFGTIYVMGTVYTPRFNDIQGVKMFVTQSAVTAADQLQSSELCSDGVLDGSGYYACGLRGQFLYFVQE